MHKDLQLGHRGASRLMILQNKLLGFVFQETISEHHKTFSPDCTRDLIDSFLEEMELRKKETNSTFNGKANKIFFHVIRRVLHLSTKFKAIYIFISFDYKEMFLQNYLSLSPFF